jgi:tetratricopeptide (TPR) repeat protein
MSNKLFEYTVDFLGSLEKDGIIVQKINSNNQLIKFKTPYFYDFTDSLDFALGFAFIASGFVLNLFFSTAGISLAVWGGIKCIRGLINLIGVKSEYSIQIQNDVIDFEKFNLKKYEDNWELKFQQFLIKKSKLSKEISDEMIKIEDLYSESEEMINWQKSNWFCTKGNYLGEKKLYYLAIEHFKESIKIKPDNIISFLGLSVVYEKLGNRGLSEACVSEAPNKMEVMGEIYSKSDTLNNRI